MLPIIEIDSTNFSHYILLFTKLLDIFVARDISCTCMLYQLQTEGEDNGNRKRNLFYFSWLKRYIAWTFTLTQLFSKISISSIYLQPLGPSTLIILRLPPQPIRENKLHPHSKESLSLSLSLYIYIYISVCVKFPSKDLDSQPLPWQRTHETCPPPQPLPWHRIFSLFKLFNYNLASSYMFKICSYNKLFVFLNVEVGLTICINLQFIIKNYVDIFNYIAPLFSY